MAHLSTKSEYAIRALVGLALADGAGPVPARDIVVFTGVPPKYLEQVMAALRKGGLVQSRRGKGGGYLLAVDPASVSFADVIDLIDGRGAGSATLAGPPAAAGGRMQEGGQAEALVAPVWREVRECARAILGSATIAAAAARATRAPMYHI